jgi:hypothetical protein
MPNTHHAVASTGLLVAALRAVESERDDALFTDSYAVRLAGLEGSRLLADYLAATGPGPAIIEVRIRFWDEALLRAAARGARRDPGRGNGRAPWVYGTDEPDAKLKSLHWTVDVTDSDTPRHAGTSGRRRRPSRAGSSRRGYRRTCRAECRSGCPEGPS